MDDLASEQRLIALFQKVRRGELTEAESEEIQLYAEDSPDLCERIRQASADEGVGGEWLARVESDAILKRAESTPFVRIERGVGVGSLGVGLVLLSTAAPLLGGALALGGTAVLAFSFIRLGLVERLHDPYKDVEK